jgi:hypothetical protein
MAISWDSLKILTGEGTGEAAIDVYDYFWACSQAGLNCSPSLLTDLPRVYAYPHHDAAPAPLPGQFVSSYVSGSERRDEGVANSIRFRPPTEGPEFRMVETFLREGLPKPLPGERLSVMVEPRVEATFPDVVAAYWSTQVIDMWTSARRLLTKADIRLLHFLHGHGTSMQTDDLLSRFRGSAARRSIERLVAAAVVDQNEAQTCIRPLDEIFALRRLVCIEAKVSAPAKALDQAVRCSWFASEVYLLMPCLPKDKDILRIASIHGIGMVLPDSSLEDAVIAAEPAPLPRSYASWMFNEWVWRLSDDPGALGERTPRS